MEWDGQPTLTIDCDWFLGYGLGAFIFNIHPDF